MLILVKVLLLNLYKQLYLNSGKIKIGAYKIELNLYKQLYLNTDTFKSISALFNIEPIQAVVFK